MLEFERRREGDMAGRGIFYFFVPSVVAVDNDDDDSNDDGSVWIKWTRGRERERVQKSDIRHEQTYNKNRNKLTKARKFNTQIMRHTIRFRHHDERVSTSFALLSTLIHTHAEPSVPCQVRGRKKWVCAAIAEQRTSPCEVKCTFIRKSTGFAVICLTEHNFCLRIFGGSCSRTHTQQSVSHEAPPPRATARSLHTAHTIVKNSLSFAIQSSTFYSNVLCRTIFYSSSSPSSTTTCTLSVVMHLDRACAPRNRHRISLKEVRTVNYILPLSHLHRWLFTICHFRHVKNFRSETNHFWHEFYGLHKCTPRAAHFHCCLPSHGERP